MSKINCNVIKDLLPSYIEDICSDDSKKVVKEHLAECGECQNLVEMMKRMEITSNQTDSRQIDYMKKVKKHFAAKNAISFILLIFCMLLEIYMNINTYRMAGPNLYYIMIPVLMFISYFALSDFAVKKEKSVWKNIAGSISLCMAGYCILLIFFVGHWTETGSYPFGMTPVDVGPFVYTQLLVIGVVQGVCFAVAMVMSLKTAKTYNIVLYINIIGGNLAFALSSLLKRLDEAEGFIAGRNRMLFIILAESVIMTVVLLVLENLGKRKKRR